MPICDTSAQACLRGRGITCALSETLRYHPACRHASGHRLPAMVARVEGCGLLADTAEFFCAADLDGKPIPPRLWHVPDFVPAGTVTTLNGDGGTGKSLAALQRAVATALGRPWLGQDVKPPPFCIALSANAGGCRVVAQPRTKDLPPRPGCRGRTLPPWRSVPEARQRAARGGGQLGGYTEIKSRNLWS